MSELARVSALMKELKKLESTSNKLCHRAYKKRFEVASKDWRTYRKVHARLKTVKKQLEYHLKLSQDMFFVLDDNNLDMTYYYGPTKRHGRKPPIAPPKK
jgi:hypothetical protein